MSGDWSVSGMIRAWVARRKMKRDGRPSRVCIKCGHVHPYNHPVYRCAECREWCQDFYEQPEPTP